jgi:hypothetical protein
MTLASTTGGGSWFCRSQPEIGEAIGQAFNAMLSQYSLIIEAPPPPLPKTLEVSLESPGRTLSWRSRFSFSSSGRSNP